MSAMVTCEVCDFFFNATQMPNYECPKCILEKTKSENQSWVDACIYYRNLAIGLGAKPEQMMTTEDRKLCEHGVSLTEETPGYWSMKDSLDELKSQWEIIDKLRKELSDLAKLHPHCQAFDDCPGPCYCHQNLKDKVALAFECAEKERYAYQMDALAEKRLVAISRLRDTLLRRCPEHCYNDHEMGVCGLTRREIETLAAVDGTPVPDWVVPEVEPKCPSCQSSRGYIEGRCVICGYGN